MADATADLGDVLTGLRTDPLDDTVHATSAAALIKAVDATGQPVWALRTGGEPISSEELLGALDAYAESLRHELADTWGQ
jgi:hypothetical protein